LAKEERNKRGWQKMINRCKECGNVVKIYCNRFDRNWSREVGHKKGCSKYGLMGTEKEASK